MVLVTALQFVNKPLIKSLLHLINSSFITGIYPTTELNISKVVPVFKKGEQTDFQNDLLSISNIILKQCTLEW